MSIASSVARSVARSVTQAVSAVGGGSSAWTPAALSNLRQWLSDNYYASPVGGLQVIESLEPHGTVRAPQPGCCALFDGVNDAATSGAFTPPTTNCTYSFWVKKADNTTNFDVLFTGLQLIRLGANQIRWFYNTNSGATDATISDISNQWAHIAITHSGTASAIYLNGALVQSGTGTLGVGGSQFVFISQSGPFGGSLRDVRIYSVAKSAPEVAAIAACDYTNLDTTGIVAGWYFNERAGTTARDWTGNGHDLTLSGPITESTFWAEDSSITANPANVLGYTLSGSTIIPRDESDITKDVQGNALGNTGLSPYPVTIDTPCITFSGTDYATVATLALDLANSWTVSFRFNQTTIGITDLFGFGDSFGTGIAFVINGDNKITYIGNGGYGGLVSWGPVIAIETWHTLTATKTGSTVELYLDGVSIGSATATSPTASSDLVLLGSLKYGGSIFTRLGKKLADLRIYPVAKSSAEVLAMFRGYDDRTNLLVSWRCQEGPGTANTNVTLYDDSGNGNHLTVVGGTVADQWDNLCPGYVRDHAFDVGGRLDALGAFVPLVPNTLLCADGNAATIAAGNIAGNPYSRVDFDPYDAAELGALAVPGEFDSLPCVKGNGSNVKVVAGTALIPATADFTFSGWIKISGNTYNILMSQGLAYANTILVGEWGVAGRIDVYAFSTLHAGSTTYATGTWVFVELSRIGNDFTFSGNGVVLGTFSSAASVGAGSTLFGSLWDMAAWLSSNSRLANLSITTGGTTKHFPLTDGSGANIACYENGVATILSNAIQGTLTNVWDSKTEGQVDHEFPEATRAIVPRDTKFTNGSTKTITTSEPAVGADLDNILGYIG